MESKTRIKATDIDNYLNTHKDELPTNDIQLKDGDIVKYNNNYYILKERSGASGVFDLYTLDNKLYKENVNLEELTPGITKELYESLYKEKEEEEKKKKKDDENKNSIIYTGGGGGGYSKTRTTKSYDVADKTDIDDTKDKSKTEALDSKLGSVGKTTRTVEECKQMINKAEEAIKTNKISINKWEDTKNASGYAQEAAIVYLNNLSNALTKLQSNLNTTSEAASDLNELNQDVKELLVEFVEKEEKEEQKKEKETKLKDMSPTITVQNDDGTTTTKENPEYNSLSNEIAQLTQEILEIDKKIEDLQVRIDNKYAVIQINYNNLINLSSYGISITGDNIFGKGSKPQLSSQEYANLEYGKLDYIEFTAKNGKVLKTYIYVPNNPENKKLPAMLYLHGDAAGGKEATEALKLGLPKLINEKSVTPQGIIIMPYVTAPSREETVIALKELTDEVVKKYNVDTDRISISGHSSGAMNGYNLINKYPNYFSCLVPISGSNSSKVNESFKNVSVWSFNSTNEKNSMSAVTYTAGQQAVDKVKAVGGIAKLTPLNNSHKYTPEEAYSNNYISPDGIKETPLEWALRQVKKAA